MQRAHIHAASLLERHAFLERFGQVCARTLVRTGTEREEIARTRRLFAALQQACSKPATERRMPTAGGGGGGLGGVAGRGRGLDSRETGPAAGASARSLPTTRAR